jgi:F0F1-type ATP synthase assembly protein I
MKFHRLSLEELLALHSSAEQDVSGELIESVDNLVGSHIDFLAKHIAPQSVHEAYDHVALLLEANGDVVGFCYGYYRPESSWMEVFAGYIERAHRRKGMAMAGFREMVKIGQQAGKSKFNIRFASENDERTGLHDAIASYARTLPVDVEFELLYRMRSMLVRGEQANDVSRDAFRAPQRRNGEHAVAETQQATGPVVSDRKVMTNRAAVLRTRLARSALPAILIGLIIGWFVFSFPNDAPLQILRFLVIFVFLGMPYSIVHELGHAISGWWFAAPPRRIQIGPNGVFRVCRVRGVSVWCSYLPIGGRTDFRTHPLERGRRIAIYAAGVGAALFAAILTVLLIPATYQWLRIDMMISVFVFCLIDLFGKAPKGYWSDGAAILGLLRYSRRS